MHFLDKKFLSFISNRLEGFAWTAIDKAVCRCPICGDSKKNKRKRRGNFFVNKEGYTLYKCHNCQARKTFSGFLYWFDVSVWQEFKLESLKDSYQYKEPDKKILDELVDDEPEQKPEQNDIFKTDKKLKKIIDLDIEHPARQYVLKRKLESYQDILYYISNFPKWASDSFQNMERWKDVKPHPRLLFPCYDTKGNLIGMTGRAFGNEIRYAHIKLSEDFFIYGLERIDPSKRVKIVEGNIDSLMISNAIARMSSNLNSVEFFPDSVIIYDNQPRNKEIVNLLKKTIESEKNVVIWPEGFEHKDLNDAVVYGYYNLESLENLIAENTYTGLMALTKFLEWKKI